MSVSHRTDVAVIGLGAMGAAVLYQLARLGIDAVGIDAMLAAARPRLEPRRDPDHTLRRRRGRGLCAVVLASHRIWRDLERATGEQLLEACGCLIMGSTGDSVHHGKTDFLGRSIASASAFGIPHEVHDGAEVMRRFPQIAGADGARAYFEPGGRFRLPGALHFGAAGGARGRSAAAMTGSRAPGSPSMRAASRSACGEMIEAGQAVVAAGAWTGQLWGSPSIVC